MVELDQALFGYDRGHRLIASSRKLGKEATWVLRNVTDMKVPKRNGHYLTVLPVADIETHAFVRTWAASGAFRPGSVWSHALLVPTADLDSIDDFRVLVSLFTRPTIDEPASLAELKKNYGKRVTLPAQLSAGVVARSVDQSLLDRIVLAAYRAEMDGAGEVVVDDAREVEEIILGLMSQRWSHLRGRFAARTRFRASQTSAARFELEVVERGSGASDRAPTLPVPEWAVALRTDLQQPNPRLRLFLRAHTREPDDHPDVVAKITDVFSAAHRSPSGAVEAIARWFPRPKDRLDLKRDLFGTASSASPISETWPTADPERLQLLLSVPPVAVALADYQVATRLADWARAAPVDAAVAIVGSDLSNRADADINELVAGIATGFDTTWVGKLIGTLPRLAPTLLKERPDVWSSPEVWTTEVEHDLLVDLITQADPSLRRATYIGLLSNGLAGAAAELLQPDPGLWWSIVDPDHANHVAIDELVIAGSRRLAMAVTSTRGPCPWQLTTLNQAIVIASVTDPDEGIWRDVSPDLWVETYASDLEFAGDDGFVAVRRDVMALAAGMASDQPAQRQLLWSLVFPRLHTALLGTGTPMGCERTLTALLPHGPSWDWCGRLRHALARTAVADDWSDVDLRDIAQGAGEFAPDVIAVSDALRHRKNQPLLDEVVDFFTSWWR
jgi:hypothetical protein